jgi:hypothetical protein
MAKDNRKSVPKLVGRNLSVRIPQASLKRIFVHNLFAHNQDVRPCCSLRFAASDVVDGNVFGSASIKKRLGYFTVNMLVSGLTFSPWWPPSKRWQSNRLWQYRLE